MILRVGVFVEIVFAVLLLTQSPSVLGIPDHVGVSTFTQMLGYNLSNKLCVTDPPIFKIPSTDLETCSWNCIVRKLCENFNFDDVTKQCDIFFDKPKNITIIEQAGCTQYQMVKTKARDCEDLLADGFDRSGVYVIYPDPQQQNKVTVYCDMDTSPGRAWTVVVRSTDNTLRFDVGLSFYATGFGNPSLEFWLGNDILHTITSLRRYSLRLDMIDMMGSRCHAHYYNFSIGSKSINYQLNIGNYSGNCTTAATSGGINLALRQPAYQSSNYSASNTADKAVDGNTNGLFSQSSCACVLDGDSNSWFVVDLGTPVFVQYVVLKNRIDCCAERLNNFIVGVSNVFDGHFTRGSYPLCGQYPGPAAIDAFLTVNCSSYTPAGRYVIIQTPLGTAAPMTICEIQVYGRAHGDGDQMSSSNGMPFSTFDSDQSFSNCPSTQLSGFWYNTRGGTPTTSLVGRRKSWGSTPLQFSEMKIRVHE